MKILLTNYEIGESRGGSQIFLRDLSRELRVRGHELAAYTWRRGPLAEELATAGVPVVTSPRACGFVPDVIHGQHHVTTMITLSAFPGVPALYHCHGYEPAQEQPPAHPRILRYVGMAPNMEPWIAEQVKRPAQDVITLPTSVHLSRFSHVRTLPEIPSRGLLFGNAPIPEPGLSNLRSACEDRGIHLDFLGSAHGSASDAPEKILPEYDIVFGIGRCALEAMASGCAVIPFSARGCLPFVEPDTFALHRDCNYVVAAGVPPTTTERVLEKLTGYDVSKAAAVTALVRQTLGFDKTCDALETLYQQIMEENRHRGAVDAAEESHALSSYLETLAAQLEDPDARHFELVKHKNESSRRLGKLQEKLDATHAKLETLQEKHAVTSGKLRTLESRLPSFLRNWLLRGARGNAPTDS